ncbi:MAG: hypothetical protein AAF125_24525, partial [Chloroflexota bacterium]
LTIELAPFDAVYALPYFSLRSGVYRRWIVEDVVQDLKREIVFMLFTNEGEGRMYRNFEQIWVCLDMIEFLCASFSFSPEIKAETVQDWQQICFDIWRKDGEDLSEGSMDSTFRDLILSFDKLHNLTLKWPNLWGYI